MSSEVSLDCLVAAHEGLSGIIRAFYPGKENNDSQNTTEFSLQDLDKTLHSTKTVENFLEDVSALAQTREDLVCVVEKITTATVNKTSSSLTHPQILGSRVKWCHTAEQHMRSIIENKDLLIYHLQQPLVTNFLTMHHQYHKDLISLIGELVNIVNKLPSHISLVEEHAQNSLLKKSDGFIGSVTRTATELRNTLEEITALQTLVSTVLVDQE